MNFVPFKIIIAALVAVCTTTATASFDIKNVSEEECITAGIYFEARGESIQGMKAVANVILNRKNSKKYPKSVCAVVFQKYQFSFTHQKSWYAIQKIMQGSVKGLKDIDRKAYIKAKIIAQKAVNGQIKVLPVDSLYYHAYYVHPRWARKMHKVAVIGSHIFYRG